VVAAVGWAIVWTGLLATGQAYSTRALYGGWQMLPYDALVDDPLGSVWRLHVQPPLWNLQVGVIGAASPSDVVGQAVVSLACGMLLAASICATLRRFGASVGVAWALTAVATLNTQVLAHAFTAQYDLAVAMLIAALVWSVARLDRGTGRWRDLLVPVSLATVIVLTRALYHPLWLVAVLVVVGWRRRDQLDLRRALVCLAIPLVLVGGWVVKNEVVVGRATMSSWTGMNLLRATLPAVDPSRVAMLRADGAISDVAVVGPFRPFGEYAASFPGCRPDTHPALGVELRAVPDDVRTGGVFDAGEEPNFNFECYLPVYDAASSDAWTLMREEPGAWVTARAWATNNWFEVPAMRPPDRSPLWAVFEGASRIVLLAVPHPGLPSAWEDDALWVHATRWSLLLPAATIALAVATFRRRSEDRFDPHVGGVGADRALQTARLVVMVTVGWTMSAGIVAELGEQHRFRSATDPVVLALGGLVIVRAVDALARGRRPARSRTPDVG
jgi:hypothetical protein